MEYSEATEEAEWLIHYGGERYDITADNDLSSTVLKGINYDIRYTWQGDAQLPNVLRMLVKP
jgi:hypothetical protein